ncbi:MAG: hypothetical protein Q9181_002764 [Wetmoreana brouardii]
MEPHPTRPADATFLFAQYNEEKRRVDLDPSQTLRKPGRLDEHETYYRQMFGLRPRETGLGGFEPLQERAMAGVAWFLRVMVTVVPALTPLNELLAFISKYFSPMETASMPRPGSLNERSGGKPRDRKSKPPQSHYQQRSLSESLGTSQSSQQSSEAAQDSPSKRPKTSHSPSQQTPEIMTVNEMYNFAKPNHVDLTNGNGPATMTTVQKRSTGMARPSNTATESGPKRLIVKNLRKAPRSDPEKYINHVWTQLDAALSAILVDEKIPYSNEELYRGVENLCRQGRASPLFKSLCEKCRQGISNHVEKPLVAKASTLDNTGILRAVTEAWNTWTRRLKTIRSIFFFLDRSYLLHSPSLPLIEEMGTKEFRTQVFSHPTLRPQILSGACELVTADRQGEQDQSSNDLLLKVIGMFHTLSVYTSDFEPELLARSSSYIATWSDQKADTLDLAGYIDESQKLIELELRRCDHFGLDSTTRKSLETYLEDLLVDQPDRQKKLLNTVDISRLLQEDARDALKQLYGLLQRRDLCEKLRMPFESYISDQGSQIVFDEAREQEMIVRLLVFKKKLDLVWENCFAMHEGLGHSLREAFEAFINKSKRSNMTWGTDNPKPGEMIAKHVDMILKGGLKGMAANTATVKVASNEDADVSGEDEDVEINKQLDQVLELFRFVHGKAVFEAFYKRDLARRLLLNRSASADAEKKCGAGFTHNLEQMFKDIGLAKEQVASFKSMLEESGNKPRIDLNVSVLSASAWPSYPDVPLIVPRDVQQAASVFEQHYKVKHSGRRLTWKHSLAHCQLKANLPKGNKELVVSSYQAVVLLLFKDRSANNEVPYNEIQAATGLDDIELKRTLQSLACAKYRILSKTPKGKDVNDTDTFSLNNNFSDPKYRIKINLIQAKETKEENKETHERVAADRAYETQAAIVRIMKARKTITHAELVMEVVGATKSRGVLDAGDIKKNIEKLIEKEYMEREEGRNAYSYLA